MSADRTVTFCLIAPQATSVDLSLQSMYDKAPTGTPQPMAKVDNGIWSVTIGPMEPNWYGYGFVVDSAQIADPGNREVSFFQAQPVWPGPTSAWSWVMVPGPEADYMAETTQPNGAVSIVRYYSTVLESEKQMLVYTPPGYNRDRRGYPVLYLYSGGGGNNADWTVNMRANFILDNLISQHKAEPMIVVMPEYNLRNCADRALAGLSSGAGCVLNTVFKAPTTAGYVGAFSPNWTDSAKTDLEQNHQNLLHDPAVNRNTELLWLTNGGPKDTQQIQAIQALLDKYHVHNTYAPGVRYGATYGHVWDTWRKALVNFAPQLFRH